MSAIRNLLLTFSLVATSYLPSFAAAPSAASLPIAAQASISGVLGRDDARYHVAHEGSEWQMTDANRKLNAHFDGNGMLVDRGTAKWGVVLSNYGYAGHLISAGAAKVFVKANRVEYRRGSLTEWYVNGPAGFEQGFTLEQKPGDGRGNPLTLAMTTSGNLHADVDATRKSVHLIGNDGSTVLRYSGIEAYDANHKQLRAWVEMHGRELWLRVDDSRAQYPLVVDPIVQLGKITNSGGSFSDVFGGSVSIANDTIIVGADGADGTNGAAYVFVKPATGWTTMTETAKLTASDAAPEDFFGHSGGVAVSGTTIIVGKAPCSGGNSQTGKVYVFVKPAGGWVSGTETAQLSAFNGKLCNGLGDSVAISGDVIVTAGVSQTVPVGQAWVFVKPSGGWVTGNQTAILSSSAGDSLGYSVAINQNTIVAMANYQNGKQQNANVYVKPAGNWRNMTQTATLTSSDWKLGDSFTIPAIYGNTIVVGDPLQNSQQGAAYVFVKPSTGWVNATETAKLTASDGAPRDDFGVVATDGNVIAVGAEGAAIGGNSGQGAIYIYARPTTGWATTSTFNQKLSASDGAAGDALGSAISISPNTLVGCDFTLACYIFGN